MKKRLTKVMCFILCVAMILTFDCTGITTAFAEESDQNAAADQNSEETDISDSSQDYLPITLESLIDEEGFLTDEGLLSLKELPYDGEKYTEIVENEDGTFTLKQYTEPIKFENDDGDYEYIDNTIVETSSEESTEAIYETVASDVEVQMSDNLNQSDAIQITYEDYNIGFKPLNIMTESGESSADISFVEAGTEVTEDSIDIVEECQSVVYSETFDENTDIVITPTSSGVKEDIVLYAIPEVTEYSYELTVENAVPVLRRDGNLYFVDLQKGMQVAAMPIPSMCDSTPETGPMDIPVTLVKTGENTYIYTLYPDRTFLENAVYPVVIDPPVSTQQGGIYDTQIKNTSSSTNYCNDADMRVGRDASSNIFRSLIQINSDGLDFVDGSIKGNTLIKVEFYAYENYDGNSTQPAELHPIIGSWTYNTVKWSNQPAIDPALVTTTINPGYGLYSWDITSLGLDWYYNTTENYGKLTYGILLKDSTESLNRFKRFSTDQATSNRDYFAFTYVPDIIPPEIGSVSTTPSASTDYTKVTSATVSFTGVIDKGGSGLYSVKYSVDGSAFNPLTTAASGSFAVSFSTTGNHTITIRATDVAGNSADKSVTYKLDLEKPSMPTGVSTDPDASSISTNNASPILSWSGITDTGGSGVSYAQYKVDSGSWISISPSCGVSSGSTNISLFTTGTHTIYVRGVDVVGNEGDPISVTYILDSIPYNTRVGMKSYEAPVSFDTQSGKGYINPDSGNLLYEITDVSIQSPFGGLAFTRHYNSKTTYSTPLGVGWDYGYNITLVKQFDSSNVETGVVLKLGNGNMYFFTKNADGTYTSPNGVFATLTLNSTTKNYTLTYDNDMVYFFNGYNQIEKITNDYGNYLQFTYNTAGKLTTLADNAGNTITITYSAATGESGLIKTVTAAGKTVTYVYDTSRKLIQAYVICNSQQVGEQYTYTNGMITTVKNLNGYDYVIAYDTNGKVTGITNPLDQTMTIGYSTDGGKILITTVFNYVTQKYWYDSNSLVLNQQQFESENATIYTYDQDYRVLSITYSNGSTTTCSYTTDGNNVNTVTTEDSDGAEEIVTDYDYGTGDLDNQVIKVTESIGDGQNQVADYAYMLNNGKETLGKYFIETNNNGVTGTPNPSDLSLLGFYLNGSYYLPDVSTMYSDYDLYGNPGLKTVSYIGSAKWRLDLKTYFEYDDFGRLTKTINPDGTIVRQTYDNYGNVETITDARGLVTKNYYNVLGQKIQVTEAYGTSSATSIYYTYDKLGNLLTETDAAGNVTVYTYDALGRQTRADYEDNTYETTSYIVNADGTQLKTHYDADGNKSITVTDKKGQAILEGIIGDTTDCNNSVTTNNSYSYNGEVLIQYTRSTYDLMGNVTWTKDNTGLVTTNVYDDFNRLKSTTIGTSGLTATTTYTYDDQDNVLVESTPEMDIIKTYDKQGRVLTETISKDGSTSTTKYLYEKCWYTGVDLNKVLRMEVTNPAGWKTFYYYDANLRISNENLIDRKTAYTYDGNDNILTSTLTNTNYSNQSAVTTYEYDNHNRKTKVIYSANDQYIRYTYDNNGNVLTEELYENGTLSCTTTYTYDSMNRVTSVSRDGVMIVEYTYTSSGNVASIEYGSNGQIIAYEYDEAGKVVRVKDITDSLNPVVIREYYYEDGLLSRLVDKRGMDAAKQEFEYDSLGRLKTVKYYSIDDVTVLEEYTITYTGTANSAKNQIETETTTTRYNGTVTVTVKAYTYDNLGRLLQDSVTVTVNNGTPSTVTTSYTYDVVGNRTSMTSGSTTLYYHYNDYDQLLSTDYDNNINTTSDVVTSYAYDLSGNQISMTEGDVVTTYAYDDANWLTSVTEQEGQDPAVILATYDYDPSGQRTQKTVGTAETNYFYTGIQLLYTTDSIDNIIEQNILETDGSMICSQRPSGNYYWYRQDIRGSVTNIVDVDDDVVKSYAYQAYGNTESTGFFVNSFAYTGAVIDDETGLYYMNARYYDTETGRFISQDTYRGEGEAFWHLYLYCNGDPVNNTDPTGHASNTVYDDVLTSKSKGTIINTIVVRVAVKYSYIGKGDKKSDWYFVSVGKVTSKVEGITFGFKYSQDDSTTATISSNRKRLNVTVYGTTTGIFVLKDWEVFNIDHEFKYEWYYPTSDSNKAPKKMLPKKR